MTPDEAYMRQALELASRGRYTTDPNPRVGCVVINNDAVVGRGWHMRAGEAHAEVIALGDAGASARGATVYVTLEPCCQQGRTPPCVDALIGAGVKEVVYSFHDPNPQVAGKGGAALRDAGITVRHGLLAAESRSLNRGFVSRMTRGRPYVRTKLAVSLDGRTALASGESQWITGSAARADVHRQRAAASVILTGSGTVIADDPQLTARLDESDQPVLQPLIVIVDSKLKVTAEARLFREASPLIFTRSEDAAARQAIELAGGVIERQSGAGAVDLGDLMVRLGERGCNEVWVEAGSGLNGALVQADLVDEYVIYCAPVLLGSAARGMFDFTLRQLSERVELEFIEQVKLGDDLRIRALPRTVV